MTMISEDAMCSMEELASAINKLADAIDNNIEILHKFSNAIIKLADVEIEKIDKNK